MSERPDDKFALAAPSLAAEAGAKPRPAPFPLLETFNRLLRVLTFLDLPIRRKFLLFAAGTCFWFFFIALAGVVSMSAIHYYYHQISENSVPYRQTIATVLDRLGGLERDLELVLSSESGAVAAAAIASSREQTKKIREEVAGLGLRQNGNRRLGTIVEQILQSLAKSNPEGLNYLQRILDLSGRMEREMDDFFLLKRDALQGRPVDGDEMAKIHAAVQGLIGEAVGISQRFVAGIDTDYLKINEQIYHIIRSSVHVILVVLFFAMGLLFFFIRWIIVAFQQPIEEIIRQIEFLGTGDIDRAKKVSIMSRDEIGTLSRKFNDLIDSVYGMTVYKKIIEEDPTLDDVYRRLGEVFSDNLGIDEYTIYEVDANKKEMRVSYPLLVEEGRLHCHGDILSDCTLCRAVKTGHNISSFEYHGICRMFQPESDKGHVCVPLMLSGKTGGVVQFVLPMKGVESRLDSETACRLFKAETYIDQSLSVIEAKRLMNTLRDSAMIDPMTGLYNRRFLQDHVKQLVSGVRRRGKQIGLLVCDLDYFKQVNDTHGHDVGDQLLKELAVLLKKTVRESDVVIRFGGEEFLVMLLDVEPGDSLQVAEKIREKVEQLRIMAGAEALRKTISIGISEFPKDSDGFWQAIKFADVALYQAKEQGRNRVVRFAPEMWTHGDF